jgi:hypothetical protein
MPQDRPDIAEHSPLFRLGYYRLKRDADVRLNVWVPMLKREQPIPEHGSLKM